MKPFEVSGLNFGPSGPSILGGEGGDGMEDLIFLLTINISFKGIINDPTHAIAIFIIM